MDISAMIQGISVFSKGFIDLKNVVFSSNTENKEKHTEILKVVQTKIQELDKQMNMVNDSTWSINAYFELYGSALELYTSSDDFIKNILKAPEEIKELLADTNYYNVKQKFDEKIAMFLLTYAKDIDQADEMLIEKHINDLRDNIGEAKGCLTSKDYKELEKIIKNILRTSNQLRTLSYQRQKKILMELQRMGKG